ncbi:antigen WC1.1-like, partial [Chroicocephalus ridibundus]|uniref:antigen WC1.1-like n=1 Tax=Chroicocephalus ridibundus TaxID=1192867 RepID=UPI002FDDB609
QVRLVNGPGRCAGRVEIYYQGSWGSVCDDGWDRSDAAVVCRQLGCGGALEAVGSARFGEGSAQIWLESVNCSGAEAALWDCPAGSWGQHDCGHKEDAGVVCSEFMALRLEKGTNCSGRLQVFYNGTWGSVCSNSMTPETVSLACKELGCGDRGSLETQRPYGRLSSTAWLDRVECGERNSSFWQCPSAPWHPQSCDDLRDETHITCKGAAEVRLENGGGRCAGRVEVKHQGQWGTVCDDSWDTNDAAVVCKQLGCGSAVKAHAEAYFGAGSGPIWMDDVKCHSTESALSDCRHNGWGQSNCDHGEDAGVTCSGFVRLVGGDNPCSGQVEIHDGSQWKTQVRLVNGPGRCAGRVEIYYQGSWGSVCDDGWDLSDAAVVCHQLGCGGALEAVGSARFGEGSAQIWLESVNCSGAEAALWDCPAGSWGQHDCGHKEDAGVVCSEFMALRLENGTNCSGRLQVFYNGTWGSVCSNSMTPETVSLACKELGCGDRGSLETQRPYGRLSGTAWLDRVECGERNSSFWQCPSAPWHPQSCDDLREETHITCKGSQPETPPAPMAACPSTPSCTDREKIRAMGGEKGCSGRVEVWHRGSWGTVCDDSWDMRDAEVACRQLGCGPAVSALAEAAFGEGSGPIWLEQVECRGTEPSLQDCWARPGDSGACRHKEDAAVNCSDAPRTAAPTPPADPTRGRLTGSGRVSLPVIMCIILGALVCLLLALLAGQVRSARAGRRGSERAQEPFPEAVYEEIGSSPAWQKQARFSGSGAPILVLIKSL